MSISVSRSLGSQQALNRAVKAICDVMRRSNCAGATQYIPELTWILFLHLLDQIESREAALAAAKHSVFAPSLEAPFRWRDWALPFCNRGVVYEPQGRPRQASFLESPTTLLGFVNEELFPHVRSLKVRPTATPRQKIVSEVFSGVSHTCMTSGSDFVDVLDRVNRINLDDIDDTHLFTLSQVYEGLLLKMGEKNSDAGQFFTPREIVRAMLQVTNPTLGETVYDPCCGTGGFLAQAYEFIRSTTTESSQEQNQFLKHCTFYGREKENLVYPIALANLVLHGIDEPHIWHGNTLTNQAIYDGLFANAPDSYDVILTNPPFGGKEGKDARRDFAFKTASTQVLFLQHVIDRLRIGGRCGIVVDEGVLFRDNEAAFVQTRRRLLEECNVSCIVSLPIGVFVNAGASLKTNLLFFTKGQPTESIWYYDLADIKVNKSSPFTLKHFEEFFHLLPHRGLSSRSWITTREEITLKDFDLKASNPHEPVDSKNESAQEIIAMIESEARLVSQILTEMRAENWNGLGDKLDEQRIIGDN